MTEARWQRHHCLSAYCKYTELYFRNNGLELFLSIIWDGYIWCCDILCSVYCIYNLKRISTIQNNETRKWEIIFTIQEFSHSHKQITWETQTHISWKMLFHSASPTIKYCFQKVICNRWLDIILDWSDKSGKIQFKKQLQGKEILLGADASSGTFKVLQSDVRDFVKWTVQKCCFEHRIGCNIALHGKNIIWR